MIKFLSKKLRAIHDTRGDDVVDDEHLDDAVVHHVDQQIQHKRCHPRPLPLVIFTDRV